MDSNRRYPHDEYSKSEGENQRIGRNIYQERGNRPANEQYRNGQSFHNQNEGFRPDQRHYGSRPDSAYRNQQNINYGDNQNRNYPDNGSWNNRNQQGQYRHDLSNPPREYHDHTRPEQHHDHRDYMERNRYKDDDYRYRSGNRGTWEAPGSEFINQNNNQNQYRNNSRHDNEGFFDRMGNSIRNTWNNVTNSHHEENDNRYRPNQNRNFKQDYESGPRWADESETERFRRESQYRRDQNDY